MLNPSHPVSVSPSTPAPQAKLKLSPLDETDRELRTRKRAEDLQGLQLLGQGLAGAALVNSSLCALHGQGRSVLTIMERLRTAGPWQHSRPPDRGSCEVEELLRMCVRLRFLIGAWDLLALRGHRPESERNPEHAVGGPNVLALCGKLGREREVESHL